MENKVLNIHPHSYTHKVIEIAPIILQLVIVRSLPVEDFPVCERLDSFQDSTKPR